MKKFIYLIIVALILGLVLAGCLLSNVGQVPTSDQSGIAYLTKNANSKLTLSQDIAFNPVGTEHTVTATVTIDGGTEPAPDVLVDFIILGPNSDDKDSVLTDINGQATFTYTGDGGAGKDIITATLNYPFYQTTEDSQNSVDKYWLENFVTGGGQINKSTLGLPGKGVAATFAGTIGVLDGKGIVGQFQIVLHGEVDGIEGKGAVSLHCSNFTYLEFMAGPAESPLEFSGGPAESPPAATHNKAIFEGNFTIKRWDIETVLGDIETVLLTLQIVDNGEPGAGVDTFCFCDPYCNELVIDGGNFQVHNLDG